MKRSKFNLSHYRLLSCDMGELVPVALTEVIAGDTFQMSTSALVRVSPLLAPVMHPVQVRIHHWFVPHRIVWDDWEKFITGGPDGEDASVFPNVFANDVSPTEGSLGDYLGVPPGMDASATISALPFRGYALIFNEWYRDQDLVTALPLSKASGADTTTSVALQNVAWEKDYFTSSRPWTQKGPDVSLPLGLSAPVVPDGTAPALVTPDGVRHFNVGSGQSTWNLESAAGSTGAASAWSATGMEADLTAATAVNVNDVRRAFALQRYEEARARYGSRYTEYLRYLGVRSSDARLQRPEYLGGGKQTIQFSEVLQTGPDTTDEGVANLKGHGIGALRSNRWRRFFEEHGYIFTLMSVKPRTMYATALNRTWIKTAKEHFWQRELQHIGQQEVFNMEVHGPHATPAGVFGYQDRYDEYRRHESGIAGDFRTTLDFWHYARVFATDPALNADFVKSVPTKRVNAVSSEDVLWVMANHRIVARRLVAAGASSHIF